MNDLNSIVLEGRLVSDPIMLNFTATSSACRLAIANNRYVSSRNGGYEKTVSYFVIYAFSNLGNTCMKYLKKGRGIRVAGRLNQHSWTSKSGGFPREEVSITAEHIEFVPERRKEPEQVATDEHAGTTESEIPKEATISDEEAKAIQKSNEEQVQDNVFDEEPDLSVDDVEVIEENSEESPVF